MEYSIDYQFLPKGAARPVDDGEVVGIKASDMSGVEVIPNVGDYVNIDNSACGGQPFSGKVRSRLFNYIRTKDNKVFCMVNIVVEEDDVDWGKLIKE